MYSDFNVPNPLPQIMHFCDVYFDTAPQNNSLYLCFSPGTARSAVEIVVNRLRDAGLWHAEIKAVGSQQKAVYAEQLDFIECFAARLDGRAFLAVRASHPKYPSQDESWEAWRAGLQACPPLSAARRPAALTGA